MVGGISEGQVGADRQHRAQTSSDEEHVASVEGDGEAEELVEEKCIVLEGIAICEWDVSWLGCACHARYIYMMSD